MYFTSPRSIGKETIDGPRFGGSGMVKGDPTNQIGAANGYREVYRFVGIILFYRRGATLLKTLLPNPNAQNRFTINQPLLDSSPTSKFQLNSAATTNKIPLLHSISAVDHRIPLSSRLSQWPPSSVWPAGCRSGVSVRYGTL